MKNILYLLLQFLLLRSVFASTDEECENSDKVRLVTRDELAAKNGEETDIWLSILGKVYDVTEGREYYGPGQSYNKLASRDSSVPFVTGTFTAEEAEKDVETLEKDSELSGVEEWLSFYETSEKYHFVGLLVDPRFYNEKGEPQPSLVKAKERLAKIKAEKEAKKKKKA